MYTGQNDEHGRQSTAPYHSLMLVPGKIQNYPDFDPNLLVSLSSGFAASNGYTAAKTCACIKKTKKTENTEQIKRKKPLEAGMNPVEYPKHDQ